MTSLRLALLCTLFALPAAAQATRTWVSGVGDDANPCSRTAPCQTFAGALSKTAAGGEISVLDVGSFGPVTITKAIRIEGTARGIASAQVSSTGITIAAGANDVVSLRGLHLEGGGTGTVGLRYGSAKSVRIEDCSFSGFGDAAIDVLTGAAGRLELDGVEVRAGGAAAIGVRLGSSGVQTLVTRTSLRNLAVGIFAGDGARALVADTTFVSSATAAVQVQASTATASLFLDRVTMNDQPLGVDATGGQAQVTLSRSAIVGSTTASTRSAAGALVLSLADNDLPDETFPTCPDTLDLSPATLPDAVAGAAYPATRFAPTGSSTAVRLAVSGLPAGMVVAGTALEGTPTEAGMYSLRVSLEEQNGCRLGRDLTLAVAPPPSAAASTTVLAISPNPVSAGEPVSATISVTGGTGVATGKVTLLDGAKVLGSRALEGGVLSWELGGLTAGDHALTARYSGSSELQASEATAVASVTSGCVLADPGACPAPEPTPTPEKKGCGCGATEGPAGLAGLVALLWLQRRRGMRAAR